MQLTPMTVAGHEQLKKELENLKKIERPSVIAAISEARAHGDLKENAEFHAAKERQSFIEGRIRELEAKLSNCRVIDVREIENNGRVIFGATVTLTNVETEEIVVYRIVGEDEADLKQQKISVTSPVARAMVGRSVDDEVTVRSPNGEIVYVVEKVEYL